jgi:CRP/FNR family transcriptional regulator, dissimilatory nitrate respiration regulator
MKTTLIVDQIKNCYLFKGTSEEEIELIFNKYHYRLKSIEKEEYAIYAEETCNDLPLLVSGSVRGEMNDSSGRRIKIEDIQAPAILASAFIFGPENKYPVDVIANEPSRILFIPKDSLIKIFRDYPEILKNFLDDISNRAQFLTRKIRFLTFKTIREKLAHYLIGLSQQQKNNIVQIPVNQTKLADFFGVARPSLSRVLGDLEKEGFIKIDRNRIDIIDKMNLLKLAE